MLQVGKPSQHFQYTSRTNPDRAYNLGDLPHEHDISQVYSAKITHNHNLPRDTMSSDAIVLASGHKMPLVGFGLWKVPADQAADIVYNVSCS